MVSTDPHEAAKAKRAIQKAANAEAAATRRAERKERAELEKKVQALKASFYRAVIDSHKEWSPAARQGFGEYCTALVTIVEEEELFRLPPVSARIGRVIHAVFVNELMALDPPLPDGFLVGQRQEWFEPLAKVVRARNKDKAFEAQSEVDDGSELILRSESPGYPIKPDKPK